MRDPKDEGPAPGAGKNSDGSGAKATDRDEGRDRGGAEGRDAQDSDPDEDDDEDADHSSPVGDSARGVTKGEDRPEVGTAPRGAAPPSLAAPARPRGPGLVLGIIAVTAVVAVVAAYFVFWRPLDPSAYAPVVAGLERVGHSKSAAHARDVCRASSACQCVKKAGEIALDADLAAETLTMIEASRGRCGSVSGGMEAEALARSQQVERAGTKAEEVLAKRGNDPHALYALAHVEYVRGNGPKAVEFARRARDAGRVRASNLLLGLVAYYDRDYTGAAEAFGAILKANPEDVEALYDQALVAHASNRYRDAREGYLKVLRLRLDHHDARFNLALMLANSGVIPEAQHHLGKLKELAPANDPRVLRLEQVIQAAQAARAPAPPPPADPLAAPPSSASAGRVTPPPPAP